MTTSTPEKGSSPNRKQAAERLRRERLGREAAAERRSRRARKLVLSSAGVVVVAVLALGALFMLNSRNDSSGGAAGADGAAQAGTRGGANGDFPFVVGEPGPGAVAPPLELPSTEGGTFNLASMRGKTTLLYFQEGLMCQPCWDQIKDLEAKPGVLRELGIDRMVSITTDPTDLLRQKVADEGLSTPVLSDRDLAVSRTYETNKYGMMGENYNGHSFIVVGPDGRIRHRADYGGPPKHTMFVPVAKLTADLREGLRGKS